MVNKHRRKTTGPGPELTNLIGKVALDEASVPVGSVPVYGAAARARSNRGGVLNMQEADLFDELEAHAAAGVDFLAPNKIPASRTESE